jgi:hypothetical protein
VILLVLILSSCYGINERTSSIASINYSCREVNWLEMVNDHSIANITDSSFIRKFSSFKDKPFETELFYFKENPKEIVAISHDHYSIRYVYNPKLSTKVLDGFSRKLDTKEVDRISKRIYSMLEKYGCTENE